MKLQESAEQYIRTGRKMFIRLIRPRAVTRLLRYIMFTRLICTAAAAQLPDTFHITDDCVQVNISSYFTQLNSGDNRTSASHVYYAYSRPGKNGSLLSNAGNKLRVVLHNAGSTDRSFKLWLNNPGVQDAIVKVISNGSGRLTKVVQENPVILTSNGRLASFPIFLKKGVYSILSITTPHQGSPPSLLPVIIDAGYASPFIWTDHVIMIIIGMLLSVVVASALVARWFPVADTLWLLTLVTSVAANTLASSGVGSMYCWPAAYNSSAEILFAATTTICFLELSRRLINASIQYRRLNRFLLAMLVLYSVAAITRLTLHTSFPAIAWYMQTDVMLSVIAGLSLIAMLEVAIYNAVKKRSTGYWWLVTAIIFAITGDVLNLLSVRGIINYQVSTQLLISSIHFIPSTMFVFIFLVQRLFAYSTRRNKEIALMGAAKYNDFMDSPDVETK
jgi:hypothetical protein